MLCRPAASMPTAQKLYLMMFVGKCSCTSHVLQYSSSLSYEHSRSLQSSLCSGAVTVLIRWALLHVFSPRQSWCEHHFVRMAWRKRSFFVEALLNLHKFEKREQNYTLFYNLPNFSAFFLHIQKNWHRFLLFFHYFFVPLHPKHQEQCPKGWLANRVLETTVVSTMRKLWRAERSIKLVWILLRRGFNSTKVKQH